jgi:hypothetical protein
MFRTKKYANSQTVKNMKKQTDTPNEKTRDIEGTTALQTLLMSLVITFSQALFANTTSIASKSESLNKENKDTDSKFVPKAENCFSQDPVLIHKGQSKSRRNGKVVLNDCYFCVTEFGHSEKEARDENFYATILTSFKHGNDKPDPITVKVTPNKPETLSGVGPNGKDEMVVFLNPNKLDLYTATAYNLKWFHRGHFDTYRCEKLKFFKDLTESPAKDKSR